MVSDDEDVVSVVAVAGADWTVEVVDVVCDYTSSFVVATPVQSFSLHLVVVEEEEEVVYSNVLLVVEEEEEVVVYSNVLLVVEEEEVVYSNVLLVVVEEEVVYSTNVLLVVVEEDAVILIWMIQNAVFLSFDFDHHPYLLLQNVVATDVLQNDDSIE